MAGKKRVLIVDDEPQIAGFVKMRLEANNFEVTLASDGLDGLKKIQEDRPDLILLDILMPNLNGFGVLAKLRENNKTKSIPVIMLTARDTPADIARSIEIGADDYIVKPFESRVLLEKIKKLL